MPYKVVPTFESVGEILSVTIQIKATEQYFPVLLFIKHYERMFIMKECCTWWFKLF